MRIILAAGAGRQAPARSNDLVAFDVASIRQNKSGLATPNCIGIPPGGRFTAQNASLAQLMFFAYFANRDRFEPYRLSGGENWVWQEAC
jgi:hypothetical protein